MQKNLLIIYNRLYDRWGPQSWWPGDTDFEVCVGAVLTQNTSWQNVEKAIVNLKNANCMDLKKMLDLPEGRLAELIKPSGYYNLKAKRLKALLSFLTDVNDGDWRAYLQNVKLDAARSALLDVYGIGPETADSILLYAARRPTFVIDKYTLRFGERYGIWKKEIGYETARAHFMKHLPGDPRLYNEYHALLVAHGKHHCKVKPACDECSLLKNCRYS